MEEECTSVLGICLKASDWAAWVQAAGGWVQAIGAIVGLWVAIKLAKDAENNRRSEAQARVDRVTSAVRVYATRLEQALSELVAAMERQLDAFHVERRCAALEDAARFGDALPFTEVPETDSQAFSDLRTTSTQSVWACKRVLATGINLNFLHWQREFEALRDRARKSVTDLRGNEHASGVRE